MKSSSGIKVSRFSLKRLSVQLTLILGLLIAIAICAFTYYSVEKESQRISENMKLQADVLVRNLSATSGDYLITKDYTSIELSLLRLARFPGVLNVQMSNPRGNVVADVQREDGKQPEANYSRRTLSLPNENKRKIIFNNEAMIVWQPIELGELLGWIRIAYSLDEIKKVRAQKWKESIYTGSTILLLTMILLFLSIRRSTHVIADYTNFAANLDENYGATTKVNHNSVELEKLGTALNWTSLRLKEQSDKISTTMDELQLLAAFPEMNPNITLSINDKNEIQYINPYARELLKELSIEQNGIAVLLPHRVEKFVKQCIENNEKLLGCEARFRGRVFYWNFAPVTGKKTVHGYAIEITQRIEAEEKAKAALIEATSAEEATKTKSDFLASMSHEIRTPLTAIIGFSELLYKKPQNEKMQKLTLNKIIRSGKHLLSIINDILDLSKIEADKLEVEITEFSLFAMMNDIKMMLGESVRQKEIALDVIYHFPIPERIHTDFIRLKQIIINLCSNAIKFTDYGYVRIHVNYEKNGNVLKFNIEDTGIGLTEQQMAKIFGAFSQADSSTTRKYGGTGLGLAISKNLTQKLGGDMSVSSEVDKGSTFSFYIDPGEVTTLADEDNEPPVIIDDEEAENVNSSSNQDNYSDFTGTILLVDDVKDNQELISQFLSDLGVKVEIANNGREAILLASNNDYDLILMDMEMPVMNGFDALSKLRSQNYSKPIVMLTGNVYQEERKLCKAAGCNDFITKPIDFESLEKTTLNYLKKAG